MDSSVDDPFRAGDSVVLYGSGLKGDPTDMKMSKDHEARGGGVWEGSPFNMFKCISFFFVCVSLSLKKVSLMCFHVFNLTAIRSLEVMRWNAVLDGAPCG